MNQELSRALSVYVIGLGSSLVLSLGAYHLAVARPLSDDGATMAMLLLFATIQLIAQLICFLHLRPDRASRSKTMTFGYTFFMMLIVVIGSIWIMRNLDYRMEMSPEAMTEYMEAQNKKGF